MEIKTFVIKDKLSLFDIVADLDKLANEFIKNLQILENRSPRKEKLLVKIQTIADTLIFRGDKGYTMTRVIVYYTKKPS